MLSYSLIAETNNKTINYTDFRDILYSNESLISEYKLLDNTVYKMNSYISMALTSSEGFGEAIKVGFNKIVEFLKKIISYFISFMKKMWEAIKKFFLFIKNFLKQLFQKMKSPLEKISDSLNFSKMFSQELITVKFDSNQISKIISKFPDYSNSALADSDSIERYTSLSLQYVEGILINPNSLFKQSSLNILASIKSYNKNTINLIDSLNKSVSESSKVLSYDKIKLDTIEEYKDEMPEELISVKYTPSKTSEELPITVLLGNKENFEVKEISFLKFLGSSNIKDSEKKMNDLIDSFNNLKISVSPQFNRLMDTTNRILNESTSKMSKLESLVKQLTIKNYKPEETINSLILKLYSTAGNNLNSLTQLLRINHKNIIELYKIMVDVERDIRVTYDVRNKVYDELSKTLKEEV